MLHLAPHPDDEAIGAPATLLALRDAGHRIINLACGLGRREDADRRRAEVVEACRRAGFELLVHEPPLGLSPGDDLAGAQRALTASVQAVAAAERVAVIVAPSPHDGHHGHEVVGRAARDAVRAMAGGPRLWLWGLWADLPCPTLYAGFGEERLGQALHVLDAHAGELRRSDYAAVLSDRAEMNRSLGSERIFGWGTAARAEPYAELLTEVLVRDGEWWTGDARELDPAAPTAAAPATGTGRAGPIGWWLDDASFQDRRRAARGRA